VPQTAAFGKGFTAPYLPQILGVPSIGSIDITFLSGSPIARPGAQYFIQATAWNQDHSQTVPAEFFWSQSNSSPGNNRGWMELVTGNNWMNYITRWGWTRAGSAMITVQTRSGATRSFSISVQEEAPIILAMWANNDFYHNQANISRSQENRIYCRVLDPNGNFAGPPTVTVSPTGTVYTTQVEGPSSDNERRMVVIVPAGGFPATGPAAFTFRQVDDAGLSTSGTFNINVQ